jgi:hypothetical protein
MERTFDMEKEFAGIDFNSERLEKRFRKEMKTLARQPGESIWGCSANRAESKAIYRMLGNERFDDKEILREHRAATINRFAGEKVILAVQDTTSLNYDTHEKTQGIGYIGDKTKGVNIHTCIAVTPDGLVLGVLDQTHYNRPQAKDDTMTAEVKKNRPIEEKESNRWPVMISNSNFKSYRAHFLALRAKKPGFPGFRAPALHSPLRGERSAPLQSFARSRT